MHILPLSMPFAIVGVGTIAVDILDVTGRAGTLSMQGLLLAALITLSLVTRYQHRENQAMAQRFMDKLGEREAAMTEERVKRIAMLMDLLRDDTRVKQEMADAMRHNTDVIRELRVAVTEQSSMLRTFNGHSK